jgi:uncharacterized protein YukE
MKHAAEAAFNTLVPARIQGQARGAWAWLTGNKPADNTNAPANDEAQRLHDQKMALLGLQTGAGLAAANLPGKAATLETVNAENEAFYTEGKRTLQDYLNVRGQLVIKEADLEFKVLFAALDSSNKELERKKKELDVVKGGTDLPQIEKTQQDYDKLLIENQKLRSELQAATEKRQQGLIGQQQLGFQNPTTLGGGVQKGWNDAVKDLGTVYTNLASTIKNTVGAAIDGVSKGITGLITGTETWGQALRNIGTSILNVVIDGLVRMFAAEVLGNQLVQASEEEKQAATIPGKLVEMLASAVSEGGWAAAALIAAAVAAVGIGVAAAAGAFAEGGRPPVGQVALVGERGPELFVPDTSGTIVPAHVTSDIMSGGNRSGRTGRAGRANGGNTTIHIHQWGDNKVEMDKYIRSMPGQHAVAEAVGKNQHIILKPS